jgi:hypothetical protein
MARVFERATAEGGSMRNIALLVVAVATLAVGVQSASASTAPTNFTFSTTIDAKNGFARGSGDDSFGTVSGVFPMIGRATLDASLSRCSPAYCYPDGDNSLVLIFTTQNGDRVWLVGDGLGTTDTASGFTGTGTWSVYDPLSTGRFASATGSGTYTATFSYNGVFEYPFELGTLSITVSGNLSFAPS